MPNPSGKQTKSSSKTYSDGTSNSNLPREPEIVSGWQYHTYMKSEYGMRRYQYLGKNEDGEPEFLDFGPQGK